jgi:hypothetical protein
MYGDSSSNASLKKALNRVLLENTDDVLCQILGKLTGREILLHLERNKGLPLIDLGSHAEEFHSALCEVLGPDSTSILESLIIESLAPPWAAPLGADTDPGVTLGFADCLNGMGF